MPASKSPLSQIARRSLFRGMFSSVIFGLGPLVSLAAIARYLWPNAAKADEEWTAVGLPSDYQIGDVRFFAEQEVYVARYDDGFMALSQRCSHLRCKVPFNPDTERFECPCHGSIYDNRGVNLAGPAPRPLAVHKMRVRGGALEVRTDINSIEKREIFAPTQVYPYA